MCGICGQYNYKKNVPADPELIENMANAMAHRGPDDSGKYIYRSLGLGFRRLSIIDIAGGHQPMSDEQENVWIVFNGEIYNFIDLRYELEQKGFLFRTNSDTEVILKGYMCWGSDVLNKLNGMFGIGIWDKNKEKLIIARDPMGIKPVYYSDDGNMLLFGSEIRAIHAYYRKKEISAESINLFLKYRYTPAPYTLYSNIKKLAPGEKITVEKGNINIERWYRFKPRLFDPMPSPWEAQEQLLQIYKNAIKRQLISDVPVGLLLSGGVDSGLLLGLMAGNGGAWPSFTVGYGETFKDDEIIDAEETAKYYQSRHHVVRLDQGIFERTLSDIISIVEEPIASSSIVPMYHVCQLARQHVKVALSGQGPDELFGGYNRHIGIRYGEYWRHLPKFLRQILSNYMSAMKRKEILKRGVYALDEADEFKRIQRTFSIMPHDTINNLFQDGIIPEDIDDPGRLGWGSLLNDAQHTDELGRFQHIELHSSLPDELLLYSDKISMAHSLEIRVPFLDLEVVQYVENIAANMKIKRRKGKWLHKRVCSNYLPRSIIKRKKRGFAVNVVDDWFRNSLNSRMSQILMDEQSSIYDYLVPEKVNKLLVEHKKGINDNHKILFSIVVLGEWLKDK